MTLSPENKAAQAIIDAGYNPATAQDIARIALNAARTEGWREAHNQAVMASISPPSPAVRGLDREAGWLIERWDELKGHHGLWWTLSDHDDAGRWTKESSIALRFAREVDAQAYINEAGWTDARPTEHAWDLAALPLAGQAEEVKPGSVPTPAMLEAGCRALHDAEGTGDADDPIHSAYQKSWDEPDSVRWKQWLETVGAVWSAMIAPLPSQPEGQSGWRPTHRHVKRGTEYQVIDEADLQTDKPLSDYVVLTLYRERNGRIWARPNAEFNDGRFQPLPEPPAQGEG